MFLSMSLSRLVEAQTHRLTARLVMPLSDLVCHTCAFLVRAQVHYRAIYYYLDEHPELLVDLLNTLQSRVDHARVVELVRKAGHLPLIKEYLLAVQKNNVSEVGGWVGAELS